jgi:hypothetical protein
MIKFLSLPTIVLPEILYQPCDQYFKSQVPGYVSYKISDEYLNTQLNEIFKYILCDIEGFFIQEITKDFCNHIHRDPRQYAINYIIDAGGDNVITSIYNSDLSVLDSKCVPINNWHYFQANNLHDVQNITSKRVSLTVSIKKFPTINTYNWLTGVVK